MWHHMHHSPTNTKYNEWWKRFSLVLSIDIWFYMKPIFFLLAVMLVGVNSILCLISYYTTSAVVTKRCFDVIGKKYHYRFEICETMAVKCWETKKKHLKQWPKKQLKLGHVFFPEHQLRPFLSCFFFAVFAYLNWTNEWLHNHHPLYVAFERRLQLQTDL